VIYNVMVDTDSIILEVQGAVFFTNITTGNVLRFTDKELGLSTLESKLKAIQIEEAAIYWQLTRTLNNPDIWDS
jgi:hypothetical protein